MKKFYLPGPPPHGMVPHPILLLLLLLLLPLPLPLSLSLSLSLLLLPLLPLLIKVIIIIARNSNTTPPQHTHTHRLRQNNLGTIIASMRSMIPPSWLEATAWNNYRSETAGTHGRSVQASPSTTQLCWVRLVVEGLTPLLFWLTVPSRGKKGDFGFTDIVCFENLQCIAQSHSGNRIKRERARTKDRSRSSCFNHTWCNHQGTCRSFKSF